MSTAGMNSGNASTQSCSLKPGVLIDGRYRINAVLARGAMGWVYDTTHIHLDRRTAIKILDVDQPILDTPEYRRRFLYEAKVSALIDHPSVIRIHDFGSFGSRAIPYIAMQFLHGHDLRQEIEERGKLRPVRAWRFMATTLSALSIAHRNNIVHKDLEPANLFLQNPRTRDERIIIVDFGVARMNSHEVGNGSSMTRIGEISGTPEYLAPEYITNQIVTPALDVYSMGLLFVELLTGRHLIEGETHMARLIAHLQGPLQLPEEFGGCVLSPLLKRALAPDHNERFQNAGAFLGAMDNIKHDFKTSIRNNTFWGFQSLSSEITHPSLAIVETTSHQTPTSGTPRVDLKKERSSSSAATRRVEETRSFDTLLRVALKLVSECDVSRAVEALERCQRVRPEHRLVNSYLRILKRRLRASHKT